MVERAKGVFAFWESKGEKSYSVHRKNAGACEMNQENENLVLPYRAERLGAMAGFLSFGGE